MITRSPKSIPENLPPAILHLEDIEEMVTGFKQAVHRELGQDSMGGLPPVYVTYQIDDMETKDIEDFAVRKKKTNKLDIGISGERGATVIRLRLNRYGSSVSSVLFDNESARSVYGAVLSIFESKKSKFRSGAHWVMGNVSLLYIAAIGPLINLLSYLYSGHLVLGWAGLAILVLIVFFVGAIVIGAKQHSTLIFSTSADHRIKREDRGWDFIKIASGAIIGAGLTLLIQFLSHKFWP